MARTKYGKTFRTRRGRYGRYKYVNGRRVAFVSSRRSKRRVKNHYYDKSHRYGKPTKFYRRY